MAGLKTYPVRMPRPVTKEVRFEMKLSPGAKVILETLAEGDGIPRAAVVEQALRMLADRRGIDYPGKEKRGNVDSEPS
jgi:hypothetical protein